ncbi:MAG: BRcat domain-containing protein [Promethearchaeota archaeon]
MVEQEIQARILKLLNDVELIGLKLDDFASKTELLTNLTRIYMTLGQVTKDHDLLEKALEKSAKINYAYNRITEQINIAQIMKRMGKKVPALNLLWRARDDVKNIRDVSSKVEVLLDIAREFKRMNEREDYNDAINRALAIVEISPEPLLNRIDASLKLYEFFMLENKASEAEKIFETIKKNLKDDVEATHKGQILRKIVNTLIFISSKAKEKKIDFIHEAIDLLKQYPTPYEIDIIYKDILKQVFKIKDNAWIRNNLDFIVGIIDKLESVRIKLEVVYDFLLKVNNDNFNVDAEYVEQLLSMLEEVNENRLSPARYISFHLMRAQLIGMFVNREKYFHEITSLLNKVLQTRNFRNVPGRLTRIFNSIVEFHEIIQPDNTEILERAITLANQYCVVEVKSTVLKNIINAMIKHSLKSRNIELLERCVDESKKIKELHEKLQVSCQLSDAFFQLKKNSIAGEILMACVDESTNVKSPINRIKIRTKIAAILSFRTSKIDLSLELLQKSIQDANLYILNVVDKTFALNTISNEIKNIFINIYKAGKAAKRESYHAMIKEAKQYLNKQTVSDIKKAIELYEKAMTLIDDTSEKYELIWIEAQIDRLKNFLQQMEQSETTQVDTKINLIQDKYEVQKSDIKYKQTLAWSKKREIVYHIQVQNNSKLPITELYCRVKRIAKDFIELMHDNVQATQFLKSKGTFSCDFYFVAKRDIVPDKAFQLEISFFDPLNEKNVSIELNPPSTNSGFRFYIPKSVSQAKFDKIKSRFEKKIYEISVPFNVFITWKKLMGIVKKIPFKVIQKDYNEIATQFFGVIKLHAESRWPKIGKYLTAVQIIISGAVKEKGTDIRLEFYLQDPLIFYNLVNLFLEEIEIWRCPNPECNAPLDLKEVNPDSIGTCKYCSTIFYFEAHPNKIDKQMKFRILNKDELKEQEKFIDYFVAKIKALNKDNIERIIERIPHEMKDDFQEKLEKFINGEKKPKDLILELLNEGNMQAIQLLIQND